MVETKNMEDYARVHTTHGARKNLRILVMVNNQIAIAYTKGKGKNLRIMGYTYI